MRPCSGGREGGRTGQQKTSVVVITVSLPFTEGERGENPKYEKINQKRRLFLLALLYRGRAKDTTVKGGKG